MIALSLGLFGLVVGSFLNVVILRHDEKPITGRSACPSCHRQLAWFDMIPVFSWIVLRGRCRSCKAPISVQYPLVEASTALLFALVAGAGLPALAMVLGLLIVSLAVCLFVYDLRHKLLPDLWSYALAICALAFSCVLVWQRQGSWSDAEVVVLAGFAAALPLFLLWLVSRGRWMGLGDSKLMLGLGWLLGFPLCFAALLYAFVIGAIVSVALLIALPRALVWCGIRTAATANSYTMQSEVPFGPFLLLGSLLVWFAALYGVPLPFAFSL